MNDNQINELGARLGRMYIRMNYRRSNWLSQLEERIQQAESTIVQRLLVRIPELSDAFTAKLFQSAFYISAYDLGYDLHTRQPSTWKISEEETTVEEALRLLGLE